MKQYKQLFEWYTFDEGKNQAKIILQKVYSPDILKQALDILENADPTPQNEYIEVFARIIAKDSSVQPKDFEQLTNDIEQLEKKRQKIDLTKIKTFQDLKTNILSLTNSKHWINKANISSDAVYNAKSIVGQDILEWYNGTWNSGTWKDGTWNGGYIYSKKFKANLYSDISPDKFYEFENEAVNIDDLKRKIEERK